MKRRGLTLLELLVVLAILISLATIVVPVIGTFGRKSQQVATRENLLRLQELLVNQYWADMGELPRPGVKGLADGRKNHPQLRYLFVNPDSPTEEVAKTAGATLLSARHWNGPYVRHAGARYQVHTEGKDDGISPTFTPDYGLGDDSTTTPSRQGDPTILDAWGRPIVLQQPYETGTLYSPSATDKTYARLVSAGPNGKIDSRLNVLMPKDTVNADGTCPADSRGDDIVVFLFRHDEFGEGTIKLDE
jgi:prepilin-type N-terminal cleavage/methylation domain-containing protein